MHWLLWLDIKLMCVIISYCSSKKVLFLSIWMNMLMKVGIRRKNTSTNPKMLTTSKGFKSFLINIRIYEYCFLFKLCKKMVLIPHYNFFTKLWYKLSIFEENMRNCDKLSYYISHLYVGRKYLAIYSNSFINSLW